MKFLIFSVLSVVLFSCVAPAQEAIDTRQPQQWISEEWTGNDSIFLERQKIIDAKPSTEIMNLLAEYEGNKNKNPQDAIAQFNWAYTVRKYVRAKKPYNNRPFSEVRKDLSTPVPPKSYSYSRLRFLIETDVFPSRSLKPLGERILKKNPKDYEVMYALSTKILDPTQSPEEKEQILRFAEILVKKLPNSAAAHSLIGSIYFDLWLEGGTSEQGRKSVAAYKNYLRLAPKDDDLRKNAQIFINWIGAEEKSRHKK